ncbi:hypothetical protein EMIHUDRAFT_209163 [Emiliania huxleyi CCMP1516]|uniref:Uncharacterized protein n=2 Tax=Emiliania huxleyi TaxID=2903 RepID=A0A0D3J7T0_EMIH1|nr:hypothetical protein EMIHUDRAFT_209163 [Emiliania huxleyi CCMP1516]EOD19565.1 hypothetical protein EMIHUDRAFT_209163 [Emiliania huxleyi CCMP1516]|eukprot:XP_005771994.1 hypothetical protein EMIHUDRAFT_209163 [Emiliania huxleyi CCMP1516]
MVKQRSNRAGAAGATPRSRFINRAELQKAILAQDVAAARVCLDSGISPDTNMTDYACHALAANGGRSQQVVHDQRTAIAQLLGLASDSLKADVEKAISPLSVSEALYEAALAGWLWLLEQMLKHGADVLALLLEARANPDTASAASGHTALSSACSTGLEKCALLLECYGARRHTAHRVPEALSGGELETIEVDQLASVAELVDCGMRDFMLDTSDWVSPLPFWLVAPLARTRALLRDGAETWPASADVFATLELPRRWRDARRDCHATPMADARAWLAGKRVGALWPSQADSWSEPGRRSAVEGRVEEAHVTAAAALLVEARERSHALFPPQMRARACDLAWLGHLAARALEALAEERAFDAIIGERERAVELGVLREAEAEVDALTDAIARGKLSVRDALQQHRPAVAALDPACVARAPHFSAVALLDAWRDRIMPQALRRDDRALWYCSPGHGSMQAASQLSDALYMSSRQPARWLGGTTVLISGVRSAAHAHLNGTTGTIRDMFPTASGRWPVRTDWGVLALKPENIAPAGLEAFR